jgi:hypothetical protein
MLARAAPGLLLTFGMADGPKTING